MANRFIYPRSEMMTYGLATNRKPISNGRRYWKSLTSWNPRSLHQTRYWKRLPSWVRSHVRERTATCRFLRCAACIAKPWLDRVWAPLDAPRPLSIAPQQIIAHHFRTRMVRSARPYARTPFGSVFVAERSRCCPDRGKTNPDDRRARRGRHSLLPFRITDTFRTIV